MFARKHSILVLCLTLTGNLSPLAGATPPSLDELLKEYCKHELPLPPKEAKLVRYMSFDSGTVVLNGKVGEETYLLNHVFVAANENEEAHLSVYMLNVLLAKYPKHIPSLYRTVLETRPELDSGMLVDAFVRCHRPAKETMDLLAHAANHKDNKHRLSALRAIKDLDKRQFDALLLAAIENLPKDVSGSYWTCPEAAIAHLATQCDDPRIWAALEKVAKRSAVGLRMEMLNFHGKGRRAERLRLLAAFLEDDTVRMLSGDGGKLDGPCAGFLYKKLAVRDFAALELAAMLGIEIEVKLDRTGKQWAQIRDRVRAALKVEQSKSTRDRLKNKRHFRA